MFKFTASPILRALHRSAHRLMLQAGFRFELRHHGEFRLGLLRKTLRKKGKGGPPRRIVLLPGFGDTPLSWLGVVGLLFPVLRRNFDEIILVDFPGFQGLLAQERAPESMDLLTESVYALLDSLKPRVLLGHSLGGWLTAGYAIHCGKLKQEWLEKVILVAPSGVFGTPEEKLRWEGLFRQAVDQGFEPIRHVLFAKEPRWFKYVVKDFTQFIQRPDIVEFLGSFAERHALEPHLDHIRCEVRLVWGEHDQLVPTHWYKTWLKRLGGNPGAVLIRGSGHSPQLEAPRSMASLITRLLEDLDIEPAIRRPVPWTVVSR